MRQAIIKKSRRSPLVTLLLAMALLGAFLTPPHQANSMMMEIPEEIANLPPEEQERWVEAQTLGGREEKIEAGKQRHDRRMAARTRIAESMTDFSANRIDYIREQQEVREQAAESWINPVAYYGIPGLAVLILIIIAGYFFCRKVTASRPEDIPAG